MIMKQISKATGPFFNWQKFLIYDYTYNEDLELKDIKVVPYRRVPNFELEWGVYKPDYVELALYQNN